jgi:hypothetical protein
MKQTVPSLIVLACSLSIPLFSSTIYSNTTTDTGDTLAYAANGYTQIGDQIHLAGAARQATLATVQLFNNGSAGTFNATLRLFNVGAPVGSQIGSDFVVSSIAAPAGDVFDEDFILPGLIVPDDLIFTVSISNASAGVDIIGLDMFEPPTIGSSDNTFAIANDGTNFLKAPTPDENVFFQLQAISSVPEPRTAGLAGAALLVLLMLRHRA